MSNRLQNNEFDFKDLFLIKKWAEITRQNDIFKAVERSLQHCKETRVSPDCTQERLEILNGILSSSSPDQIKQLFIDAKYSDINGICKKDKGFLAEIITKMITSGVSTKTIIKTVENLIAAGADPDCKRNGKDAFMESSTAKKKNKYSFPRFPLFSPSSPASILKNAHQKILKQQQSASKSQKP